MPKKNARDAGIERLSLGHFWPPHDDARPVGLARNGHRKRLLSPAVRRYASRKRVKTVVRRCSGEIPRVAAGRLRAAVAPHSCRPSGGPRHTSEQGQANWLRPAGSVLSRGRASHRGPERRRGTRRLPGVKGRVEKAACSVRQRCLKAVFEVDEAPSRGDGLLKICRIPHQISAPVPRRPERAARGWLGGRLRGSSRLEHLEPG
jgi:hypothetical protein